MKKEAESAAETSCFITKLDDGQSKQKIRLSRRVTYRRQSPVELNEPSGAAKCQQSDQL
jgi:hypothetical protein